MWHTTTNGNLLFNYINVAYDHQSHRRSKMASGITNSLRKEAFAVDLLKDRVVRGSFEKNEYFSQKNVIVRDKNRKDRGIRQAFRKSGKAPAVK